MSRIVHFEIHAENPQRAADFYIRVLGWKITKWEGPVDYWLVQTGRDDKPGINGAIMERKGILDGQAVIAYVCTAEVDSLDDYVKKVEDNNGQNYIT